MDFTIPAIMNLHLIKLNKKEDLVKHLIPRTLIHPSYANYFKPSDWNENVLLHATALQYEYNLPIRKTNQENVDFFIRTLKDKLFLEDHYLEVANKALSEVDFNFIYTYIVNNLKDIENMPVALKIIRDNEEKINLNLLKDKYNQLKQPILELAVSYFGLNSEHYESINRLEKGNFSSLQSLTQKEQIVIIKTLVDDGFNAQIIPEAIYNNVQSAVKDTSLISGKLFNISKITCCLNEEKIDTALHASTLSKGKIHFRELQKIMCDLEALGMNKIRKSSFVTDEDILFLKEQQPVFNFDITPVESEKYLTVSLNQLDLIKIYFDNSFNFTRYEFIKNKEEVNLLILDSDKIFKSIIFTIKELIFN